MFTKVTLYHSFLRWLHYQRFEQNSLSCYYYSSFSLFTLLCLSFEPTREPSFNRHRFDHIHPLLNLQTLFALGNAGRRILRRRRRRPSFHGTLLKRLQSTAVPESFPRQKPWWLSQERSPENCKKVSNFRYPFVLSIIFFTESRLFFKWVCGVWLFIFYFLFWFIIIFYSWLWSLSLGGVCCCSELIIFCLAFENWSSRKSLFQDST